MWIQELQYSCLDLHTMQVCYVCSVQDREWELKIHPENKLLFYSENCFVLFDSQTGEEKFRSMSQRMPDFFAYGENPMAFLNANEDIEIWDLTYSHG